MAALIALALRTLAVTAHGTCAMDGLEAKLTEMVGRDPLDARAADVLEVVSWPGGGTVRLAGGEARELEAPTCEDLVEAVAVIASIWVREPAVEPHVERVAVEAVADVVVTDGQPGALLGGRVRRGRWTVGAEVERELGEDEAGVAIGREGAVGVACVAVAGLDACATAGVRRIVGRGDVSAANQVGVAGARVEWRRKWLRLHAGVDASAATTTFRVDDMVVWTSPRLTWSAGAGVVVQIR